jgi:hypothetical protein
MMWTGLVWLKMGTGRVLLIRFEHSGSIKCCETIECTNNWGPLEWCSAQLSVLNGIGPDFFLNVVLLLLHE